MSTTKKPVLRSAVNKSQPGAGSSAIQQKKFVMYDVFDDEEVYNMHERYEDETSLFGNIKPENRKRSFRNGNSGRGTDLKK